MSRHAWQVRRDGAGAPHGTAPEDGTDHRVSAHGNANHDGANHDGANHGSANHGSANHGPTGRHRHGTAHHRTAHHDEKRGSSADGAGADRGARQDRRNGRTLPDLDDATADAVGKLSEALEWVERARGALYEFHQLSGRADLILVEAIRELENAGHPQIAALVRRELHGRNVLDGRWTFQIVEEYDDLYYRPFVAVDERARRGLTGGMRHVHEARMKAQERARAGRDLWGPGA